MDGHFVKAIVANVTPIDARRLFVISPLNIGETLRVGRFDNVQQMTGIGRLKHRAHPLPALYGVSRKPRCSTWMARGPISERHFEATLSKSAWDLISKPSVSIHSSSQITTAG